MYIYNIERGKYIYILYFHLYFRLLQKGDVIISINTQSVLDLRHTEAVAVLKQASQSRNVTLAIIEGSETSDGIANFSPSWRFWLSMPP